MVKFQLSFESKLLAQLSNREIFISLCFIFFCKAESAAFFEWNSDKMWPLTKVRASSEIFMYQILEILRQLHKVRDVGDSIRASTFSQVQLLSNLIRKHLNQTKTSQARTSTAYFKLVIKYYNELHLKCHCAKKSLSC